MTVGELKKYLNNNGDTLTDDMHIGLLDLSTDDTDDMNYSLIEEMLFVEDCYTEESDEPCGKMLFIGFENKLNENSINFLVD